MEYAVSHPGYDAPIASPQAVPETDSQRLMSNLDSILPPLSCVCWKQDYPPCVTQEYVSNRNHEMKTHGLSKAGIRSSDCSM